MKQLIKYVLIYLECLVRNQYTLLALLFAVVGIFFAFTLGFSYSIAPLVISYFVFEKLSFGKTSFISSLWGFRRMKERRVPIESNVYCIKIGFEVAERRFKKQYPKDYEEVLRKKSLAEAIRKQGIHVTSEFDGD